MTILEQCRELREQIAADVEVRRAEADARTLRDLRTEVSDLRGMLQADVERLHVVREHQLQADPIASMHPLREMLRGMRDEVERTPSRPSSAARVLRALRGSCESASGAVVGAIEQHFRETTMLRDLARIIPAIAPSLRELQGLASSDVARLPATELRKYLKTYTDAVAKLGGAEGLSPDVVRFLTEATKGGAKLESLTESVREWLKKVGLLRQVRVIVTPRRE